MRRKDYYFIVIIALFSFLLILPFTHHLFFGFTNEYKVLGGFIKFFLFATIGDIISWRLIHKNYRVKGLIYKAIVWGLIGVVIVFIFDIFHQGVLALQASGLLPLENNALATAFLVSLFMNFTFAPTMMMFHRISDRYIERKIDEPTVAFNTVLKEINYLGFIRFVVFKTLPLFWLPAHTITFILPAEYRVFFASLLGVALGLILGLAKHVNTKEG